MISGKWTVFGRNSGERKHRRGNLTKGNLSGHIQSRKAICFPVFFVLQRKRFVLIITNNLKVKDHYAKVHKLLFVEGGYRDVLVTARDLVHKGHLLETHPLMGSLKPNETPYRSVIISDDSKACTDSNSAMMIEDSILVFDKFAKIVRGDRGDQSTEKIKEDFREIDLSLIRSALE